MVGRLFSEYDSLRRRTHLHVEDAICGCSTPRVLVCCLYCKYADKNFTVSGRERKIWRDQQFEREHTLKPFISMACDVILVQPSIASEQICQPRFTQKASVNSWYDFSSTSPRCRTLGSSLRQI